LTEITYDVSHVLIVCVIGVWRHILDSPVDVIRNMLQ